MSFSPEWLALREPADHASVNALVRQSLRSHFAGQQSVRVVDLGCGAGSNLRGTWNALGQKQHWTLVDYDSKLLATAKQRLSSLGECKPASDGGVHLRLPGASIEIAFEQADLSSGDTGTLLSGADLVTAAALFDLISTPVIEKFAESIAANRQVFYTVLTYDGIAAWLPAHPADNDMRRAFNAHQRGDKGFGPAEGPAATDALAAAFQSHGYKIIRGHSPWVLDRRHEKLRAELDAGFASAVNETGAVANATVKEWLDDRRTAADAVTIIGHEDLLAVPA